MPISVSIITITLNSQRHLAQTISSVVAQDYPDIEYIVVDGGSTDGTLDIIKEHSSVITGWVSEPDKGISDAFNKGIAMSTGDVVGILNSDDFYEPGAVSEAVRAFKRDSATGVVHGDVRYMEDGRDKIKKPVGRSAKRFWKSPPYMHPTMFVRRQVYEEHGTFDLSYSLAMDFDLMLRFINKKVHFQYVPGVITNMREGGVSSAGQIEAWRESERVNRSHGCDGTGMSYYFLKKRLKRRLRQAARVLINMPFRCYYFK